MGQALKVVTITQQWLDELLEKERLLDCLKRCGVEKWELYETAYKMTLGDLYVRDEENQC